MLSEPAHRGNRMRKLFTVLALGALASFTGCSDDVEDVVDCVTVCHRYKDCIDDNYEVDACIDRCEEAADDSEARRRRLRECSDCIDDRSCASASFVCSSECIGIVP